MKQIDLSIIKTLAKKQKITLKEISKQLGISETGFQYIIKNNSTSLETLGKIADILNVSVGVFFGEHQILEDIKKAWEIDKPKIQKIIDNVVLANELFEKMNVDQNPELRKKFEETQIEQFKGTFDNPFLFTLLRMDNDVLDRWISYGLISEDIKTLVELFQKFGDKIKLVAIQ